MARGVHLAVEGDDAVNDEDSKGASRLLRLRKDPRRVAQQLLEHVAVVRASVHHILHHELRLDVVPGGDRREALRPEGALGVNVHGATLACTHRHT